MDEETTFMFAHVHAKHTHNRRAPDDCPIWKLEMAEGTNA